MTMIRIEAILVAAALALAFKASAAAQPAWQVNCYGEDNDAFGKRRASALCNVWVKNQASGWDASGRGRLMSLETIFRIDASGPKIDPPKQQDRLCGSRKPRVGVDGRDVSNLSRQAQINAVLGGTRFFKERRIS
jgi:hypothetical protein